ncbi:MAG: Aspartyl/glutamyl-tRNA(Asn/Gln) amidotransferase subunit B [Planctomycetes bacterium]|nr:Aspartyl/glutamyl-tRNA(Asn/Gln) amidotransferase subunit B [Planctomycetota bacterium]
MTPLPSHRLVIGMEVHLQLRTRTKCFCPCAVVVGDEPNRHVCPVCLGLPGALPVLNREALAQAVRGGLGLGCRIASFTKWDRKNYFYADLPKGYQITQYDKPVCSDGAVEIESEDRGPVRVRIQRAHLEEDTGKSDHSTDPSSATVDFNRCGTPLLEIVTHPDLRSADEASRYLEELRRIMRHLGTSDADMEKAQLRCEPNVNVEIDTPDGTVATRIVELKNLNSFAAVRNAIEFERERQVREWMETGVRGPRPKSTRGWDDAKRATYLLRAKEEAADYRYFPEPDLPPVTIAAAMAEEFRATLPELPAARRARYRDAFGLSAGDAAALADERPFAEWFEEAVSASGGDAASAKAVANWTMTDVRRELNARGGPISAFPITGRALGEFVRAVQSGELPREAAKSVVFPEMAATGRPWRDIAAEKGIGAVQGDALLDACRASLAANPDVVAKFRSGKTGVKGVLVGDVMKRTRGQADARRVGELLDGLLNV